MYLSYSGFDQAITCLFSYWNSYINKTEVGQRDRLSSIYGSTIGSLMEVFFKQKLWRQPKTARATLEELAPKILDRVLADATDPYSFKGAGVLNWKSDEFPKGKYTSREMILADILASIPRCLGIIKHHKLVGSDADAEVKLEVTREGHCLDGRADFIMTQIETGDFIILDGKATEWGTQYLSEVQLLWYAALSLEKDGRLPTWTAFVLWRKYAEDALVKHIFTEEQARAFFKVMVGMADMIEGKVRQIPSYGFDDLRDVKKLFPATPSEKCDQCDYSKNGVCKEGASPQRLIQLRSST